MNAHPDPMAPSGRPPVAWQRLLVAIAQSAALFWLHRAAADRLWPVTVPVLLVPLVLVLVLCPMVWIINLGRLAPRPMALWLATVTALVAALGLYDVLSTDLLPGERASPSFLPSVCLVAILFIVQTVLDAASAPRQHSGPGIRLVANGWRLAVRLALSVAFVIAVWLLLILAGALFKLVAFERFAQLFLDWFSIPVFACAFACAIHVTDVRRSPGALFVLLMACLLPLTALLVGGFLCSLPFTGIPASMATGFVAAWLLALAVLLALMIEAVRHASTAPVLRWSARLAALLLLPLVLCAAWALLRHAQDVGWTSGRAVGAVCIVVALCHAGACCWAALHDRSVARPPSAV